MIVRIPEPAVSRRTLEIASAVMWLVVGCALSARAFVWIAADSHGTWLWLVPAAVLLGALKGHFVMARMAKKNVERIRRLSPHKEKICLFAFQSLQSLLVIAFMIGIGTLLRSLPIRRDLLAGIYLMVGIALVRGSHTYWKN